MLLLSIKNSKGNLMYKEDGQRCRPLGFHYFYVQVIGEEPLINNSSKGL